MRKQRFWIRMIAACGMATLVLTGLVIWAGRPARAEREAEGGAAPAATPVDSILSLYSDDSLLGDQVVVTGFLVAWDPAYLAMDYLDFQSNRPAPPHSYAEWQGVAPGPDFNAHRVKVTATLSTVTNEVGYLGERQTRILTVLDAADWVEVGEPEVDHPGQPSAPGPGPTPSAPLVVAGPPHRSPAVQDNEAVDCGCRWAFLISGGVNNRSNYGRYANDLDQKWEYKSDYADYPDECISVFYDNNAWWDMWDPPSDRVFTATQELIEEQIAALAPAMQRCKEQGVKPTLQVLVTDHGTGYHGATQAGDADHDGLGGLLDSDGDEGSSREESTLRMDVHKLRDGGTWRMNLEEGAPDPDTRVARVGNTVTISRCVGGPPCVWKEAFRGQPVGGIVTGIDLNGDGDTSDTVRFDEGINLWGDEVWSDDEMVDALQPLCQSGVDLYVEMGQCFGGGFQEDLDRLRSMGCHVHFVAAAAEDEYSWGDDDEDFFEQDFITRMIHEITSTGQTTVTPDMWRRAYVSTTAPGSRSTWYTTTPESDIDCVVVIGPYIKDGSVCIKIINYCEEPMDAEWRLAAYNWSIGSRPLDSHSDVVHLEPGGSVEICRPLPTETGTYCFYGRAFQTNGRHEYHGRWLNDQHIVAEEPAEEVVRVFPVDGWLERQGTVYSYSLVYLEPVWDLPDGWEYVLVPESPIWVGDGPVPVSLTLRANPEILGIGHVWVHAWGVDEGAGGGAVKRAPEQVLPLGEYLGYVYVALDSRIRIFLPLTMRDSG